MCRRSTAEAKPPIEQLSPEAVTTNNQISFTHIWGNCLCYFFYISIVGNPYINTFFRLLEFIYLRDRTLYWFLYFVLYMLYVRTNSGYLTWLDMRLSMLG